jgi:hypothetical protein
MGILDDVLARKEEAGVDVFLPSVLLEGGAVRG